MDVTSKRFPNWRRLFQFRLRSLLVLVLVASMATAWYARPKPPSIGLDGYCPVTLVHKEQWKLGDPQCDALYEGRLYFFVGPNERALFESYPDRYAPVHAGADVVRLAEENRTALGERAHGLTYQGRIYLFESEATLEEFMAAPDRYVVGK